MSKTLTLIAALLMAGGAISAQSFPPLTGLRSPELARSYARIRQLSAEADTKHAQKGTGARQRLAGTAWYYQTGFGLKRYDSVAYRYSGMRGSAFNYDVMASVPYYYPFPLGLWQEGELEYDTAYSYPASGITTRDTSFRYYDASGRLTRFNSQQFWMGHYSYDVQGRMTGLTEQLMNDSTHQWDNSYRYCFSYDNLGQHLADTSLKWNGTSWDYTYLEQFTYGSNGLPASGINSSWDGSAWQPYDKTELRYTAGNHVEKVLGFEHTGAGWFENFRDTFSYSGNFRVLELQTEWDGAGWALRREERAYLNQAGLPDSAFRLLFNPFYNDMDTTIFKLDYDAAGNPAQQSYVLGTHYYHQEGLYRYYYESYQTPSGIVAVPAAVPLTFYPNPATTEVHLKAAAASRYDCRILNNLGQVLFRTNGTAATGETLSLPVQQLVPGQYRLVMEDAKGNVYTAPFVKQ